ncbi:MAG: hypothetical protein R3F29_15280 [Planctomycetota bacterium]
MRTLLLLMLTILLPATAAAQEPHAGFAEAWHEFRAAVPGEWHVRWCAATGTPQAIYGSGFALEDWRGNTQQEARRHAERLLRDRAALLGLGASDFREAIAGRFGRTWSFVFEQSFRGVPVIDGRADVRVHMTGRVAMFGSRAWPIPADFVITPALDAATATQLAWQHTEGGASQTAPAAAPRPRLVIFGDAHAARRAPFHLCWEVEVHAPAAGATGRCYVDAASGEVRAMRNDLHQCSAACTHELRRNPAQLPLPATGLVRGWLREGVGALSPLVQRPLANVEVAVPGVGTVVTDALGAFSVNLSAPVTVTVTLDGAHLQRVHDVAQPSRTAVLTPGQTTTFTFGTGFSTPNDAAHPTSYYWVDRVNTWCRGVLGDSPQLDALDDVLVTVNLGGLSAANYWHNTINLHGADSFVNNTAFSSVVAHEWGHGLDDQYGGISQVEGLSEGWGDVLSMYLLDAPEIGLDVSPSGGVIRTGDNTRQYPTGSGVHEQGETFMGFAWKLRQRLATTLGNRPAAIAITEQIVLATIVADAEDQPSALLEVFLAADDDGDLANGTPHRADLVWACQQHALPYPGKNAPVNATCATATPLHNGINGPYSNAGGGSSSPIMQCSLVALHDVWFRYDVGATGWLQIDLCGLSFMDTVLQVFAGSCASLASVGCNDDSCGPRSSLSVPVSPGSYYVRVAGKGTATGSFSLQVAGPEGAAARAVPYGEGCYRTTRSFYQYFLHGYGFDLADTGMQLRLLDGRYHVGAGGTFVTPPLGATTLSLGSVSQVPVTLSSPMPYPGGSTSTLWVCGAGFVSVAQGNVLSATPSIGDFLQSNTARWATWHNFAPSAPGGGRVLFHQSGPRSYVTWNGVWDGGGGIGTSTWQLQFHRTTGDVTFVWKSMSTTGDNYLVGWADTAPNANGGNLNLSSAIQTGFRTGDVDREPLRVTSDAPRLGNTAVVRTSQVPAASPIVLQLFGFQPITPGFDLAVLGMAGCDAHLLTEVIETAIPFHGIANFQLTVPYATHLIGASLFTQSLAFSPGANDIGLISSNGLELVLGT